MFTTVVAGDAAAGRPCSTPASSRNLFLSLVHDDADVDQTLTATAEAFAAVRRMPQLTGAHG